MHDPPHRAWAAGLSDPGIGFEQQSQARELGADALAQLRRDVVEIKSLVDSGFGAGSDDLAAFCLFPAHNGTLRGQNRREIFVYEIFMLRLAVKIPAKGGCI